MNFGAIGMVVGHELTHGFDDEGRQFDAKGNLDDWWTPESGKAFVERADCVKKQFDGYVAIDEVHVNGALTLGRERGRPGRDQARLRRDAGLRQGAPGPRRSAGPVHAGAGVLPRHGAGLVHQRARRGGPPADRGRSRTRRRATG